MAFSSKVHGEHFTFSSLKEVLGRANEVRSGDLQAGLAARSMREMAAAKQVLADACVELFGVEHRVLHMLDASSAASLLGDKAKVDAYAKLLDAAGDTARAEALRRASR